MLFVGSGKSSGFAERVHERGLTYAARTDDDEVPMPRLYVNKRHECIGLLRRRE
jgi:hypothetical protein